MNSLAAQVPVSRPAVSQHLKILTDACITAADWSGNYRYYRLNPATLAQLRRDLDEMWTDALAAFAKYANENARPENNGS